MKSAWTKFDGQPLAPEIIEYSKSDSAFQNAWKLYEYDKFRLLPLYLLFSGGEIKDEVIVQFFLNVNKYVRTSQVKIHVNVIVNENFEYKRFTCYTGLPRELKHLYESDSVGHKAELNERYPWLIDKISLKGFEVEAIPKNPRFRIALKRALESIFD